MKNIANKREPTLQTSSKFGLCYTSISISISISTSISISISISIYPYPYIGYGYRYGYGYGCVSVDVYVYHRPNLELACNVGCCLYLIYLRFVLLFYISPSSYNILLEISIIEMNCVGYTTP